MPLVKVSDVLGDMGRDMPDGEILALGSSRRVWRAAFAREYPDFYQTDTRKRMAFFKVLDSGTRDAPQLCLALVTQWPEYRNWVRVRYGRNVPMQPDIEHVRLNLDMALSWMGQKGDSGESDDSEFRPKKW